MSLDVSLRALVPSPGDRFGNVGMEAKVYGVDPDGDYKDQVASAVKASEYAFDRLNTHLGEVVAKTMGLPLIGSDIDERLRVMEENNQYVRDRLNSVIEKLNALVGDGA